MQIHVTIPVHGRMRENLHRTYTAVDNAGPKVIRQDCGGIRIECQDGNVILAPAEALVEISREN